MKNQGKRGSAPAKGDLFAELCRADDPVHRAELVAELQRRLVEMQTDAAGQAALADLGELAAPMAHQVNNFLNNVLLDIAVLESGLPDSHRETVEEIRRQGRALAQVVRSWQQYRQSAAEPAWRTDVAGVVWRAVQALAANPGRLGPILTRFPSDPPADAGRGVVVEVRAVPAPPVAMPPAELERLVRFLTANAIAVSSRGQTVLVRSEPSESGCLLAVEDAGPTPTSAELLDLFDPDVQLREETTPLELAACHGLVRRRGGTVSAEERPGGVRICVTLPVAVDT